MPAAMSSGSPKGWGRSSNIKERARREFSGERQAILDAYVARQTQKASSAPSPLLAPSELLDDDADKPTSRKRK